MDPYDNLKLYSCVEMAQIAEIIKLPYELFPLTTKYRRFLLTPSLKLSPILPST